MGTTRATPRKTTRSTTSQRKPKADTAAILGNAAEQPKIPAKWQAHYRKLITLREHLSGERKQLIDQAKEQKHAIPGDHNADAGTDAYDQDFALGVASAEQEALFEIEEALNRIKTGRYGICEATGKPIDPARLEAIPWTRFSVDAERDLEAHNAVDHTRLGERRDLPRSSEPSPGDKDAEGMEG